MKSSRLLLCASLLALTGCFAHTPIPVGQAEVGSRVRARISASQAERLAEVLGREERVLEGRVVGLENGDLLLQVPGPGSSVGQTLGQRVVLAPGDIQDLQLRRLDRARTGALVAALTIAGGITAHALFSSSGTEEGNEGPPPNEARIPIFRITW